MKRLGTSKGLSQTVTGNFKKYFPESLQKYLAQNFE